MDVEPAPREEPTPDQHETFCRYLAKQLIARQGFVVGAPAEARDIAEQSDYVLSFSDGYSPVIVGLIDREAHPGKAFTLTAERVHAIAEACRALAGRVGAARMPVTIRLMEVGGATPDQPERLGAIRPTSLFSKLIVSAWAIDPARRAVWTSADHRGWGMRRFIRKLLEAPREAVVMPPPVAVAPRSFPWLTAAMIAVLAAIFAGEIAFGVGGTDRLKQPTVATLVAFGGLTRRLMLESGEWYRLLTAPLLHGGFEHIALNAVAFGLGGYVLEPLIGRAWLAALLVVGALTGALFSLALNSDAVVSVGASGAVMALFACMLVVSRRFPRGEARTRLQMNAIYVLLPSMLPLAGVLKGTKVDYAAHFGGALGGVTVGLLLLALWRADAMRPRLRGVAAVVALAGLAAFAAAGALAHQSYPVYELSAALAPQAEMPASDEAARRQSAELVARYPRDPRAQFLHAVTLIRARDLDGAERALRAGLAEEPLWRRAITGGDLPERTHALLALVLSDLGRNDEAREVARPACALSAANPLRATLDRAKLCAN